MKKSLWSGVYIKLSFENKIVRNSRILSTILEYICIFREWFICQSLRESLRDYLLSKILMLILLSKYLPNLDPICLGKSDHSLYIIACEHFKVQRQAAYFFLDPDLIIAINTSVTIKKICDICSLKKKTSKINKI